MSVRLDPNIHQHITTRPEGPRAYLERIVQNDMTANEPWYLERFRVFDQLANKRISDIPGAESLPQWVISAATSLPQEKVLEQTELAKLCRRSSINRTGWPLLYCDQGLSMRSWGVEAWIDHSLGSTRLDSWNLDARGAFHHVATRDTGERQSLTFQELLHQPALALETVGDLFSALAGPIAQVFIRLTLRNAYGLTLVHHEGLRQQAGPLGEQQLIWEKHLTVKELQSDLSDLAADVYERFRICFGPSTANRQQAKQNLAKLFSQSY